MSAVLPAEQGVPAGDLRHDETIGLAAEIIRIDSTNGNETVVAELLATHLQSAGVEVALVARDPRRANLTTPSTGAAACPPGSPTAA